MNYKKLSISIFLLLLLIPISNAKAFTYIDNIKDGNYIFFLIDLEEGNHLELSLTIEGSGNFTLFLFNRRPTDSNVNEDKSLKSRIFNNPPTVNYSLADNPYIYYTANVTKIYYIEIILVSGGPDTYTLISTRYHANNTLNDKDLTRYYLPIIPGFRLEYLLISLTFTVGVIFILFKKKMSK